MMRLALAQFKPGKGVYSENLAAIGRILAGFGSADAAPDVLVFPESALTGYLLEGGVRDLAVSAGQLFEDLTEVHKASKAPVMDLAIGFYEKWRGSLYNSALYATLGGKDAAILHVHRKVFLPTYGVFDEERFVESGLGVEAFDTRFGRIGVLICEDAWHSLTPTALAVQGARLILIHSASPARGTQPLEETISRPANVSRWERISRYIAEEHGVWVGTSQLVGFEGGKGFAGGSCIITPRGDVLARGPLWEQGLVQATIDFEEVGRARADTPLLADLQTKLPHLLEALKEGQSGKANGRKDFDPAPGKRLAGVPTLMGTNDPMAMDAALVETWLVQFLKEEVAVRRGFCDVVVALSGGVDSALVTYLAVKAFGADHVHAVMMPYRTSSADSLEHAKLVVKELGIDSRVVDITAAVDGYLAHEPDADASRRGNVMARVRMLSIFDHAAKHRALPLGTGNKTERLLGYFTWHADDSPPINPIGDLYKSQVWQLAKHLGVPEVIVNKPATADLVKGQTDESDLGIPYPKADRILFWLLRGLTPPEIVAAGYTADEVRVVDKRLSSTHWKRRLPTVAMLSPTAIGEYYLRPVDY